jgi:hypothetical protein
VIGDGAGNEQRSRTCTAPQGRLDLSDREAAEAQPQERSHDARISIDMGAKPFEGAYPAVRSVLGIAGDLALERSRYKGEHLVPVSPVEAAQAAGDREWLCRGDPAYGKKEPEEEIPCTGRQQTAWREHREQHCPVESERDYTHGHEDGRCQDCRRSGGAGPPSHERDRTQ